MIGKCSRFSTHRLSGIPPVGSGVPTDRRGTMTDALCPRTTRRQWSRRRRSDAYRSRRARNSGTVPAAICPAHPERLCDTPIPERGERPPSAGRTAPLRGLRQAPSKRHGRRRRCGLARSSANPRISESAPKPPLAPSRSDTRVVLPLDLHETQTALSLQKQQVYLQPFPTTTKTNFDVNELRLPTLCVFGPARESPEEPGDDPTLLPFVSGLQLSGIMSFAALLEALSR